MNRFITRSELEAEVTEYLEAVNRDLTERPLKPGEQRCYPNPICADFMPLIVEGE